MLYGDAAEVSSGDISISFVPVKGFSPVLWLDEQELTLPDYLFF